MERGQFGYPTSDEEYVPQGYRRNTFQKGGIFFIPTTNKIFVGIGNKPTGYQYKFTSGKFLGKGGGRPKYRSKTANTFVLARDLNVKMTKVKYSYLPTGVLVVDSTGPSIIDLSTSISSTKKSFKNISSTMTFRK
ncbi:MAG: hypothetical protein M3P08_09785 [Thermoproteota archaeon]|nr:hypothetical protein [Thermoproteota archaeon]